jgi:hypothetical protein
MRRGGALAVLLALVQPAHGEEILARGPLTVVDAGENGEHALLARDGKNRSLEIPSERYGLVRARVGTFLGERDLVDITVSVELDQVHSERHVVVRTSGAELKDVCELEGSVSAPPDSATRVTFRKVSAHPVVFQVERLALAGKTPPVGEQWTLEADGMCDGPLDIAPLEPAVAQRVLALAHARGFHGGRVVKALARETYLIEASRGKKNEQEDMVLFVAPRAAQTVLVLAASGMRSRHGGLDASLEPFLHRTDLWDLEIRTQFSNGMGGSSGSTHHLVRDLSSSPQIACAFSGSGGGGMEDRTSSTNVTIEKRSDKPFSFVIRRKHSEHGAFSLDMQGPRSDVDLCTVPARGVCTCEFQSGSPDLDSPGRYGLPGGGRPGDPVSP